MPMTARKLPHRDEAADVRVTGRRKRNSLSRDVIVAEALAMLQDGALDALTLRGLAQRLGIAPMSLYTHFSSRDDLIRAVSEYVFTLFEPPPAGGTWQDHVRNWLWANYRLFERYPVASKIIVTNGGVCVGWLRTMMTVAARLQENGLEGYNLAFAMDWLSTSAMAFIQAQMDAHTTRQPAALTFISELEPDDQRRAVELWAIFRKLEIEKVLTFGFEQYVKGLEELIATAAPDRVPETHRG
jgi:AcrR family transcriptional regulator